MQRGGQMSQQRIEHALIVGVVRREAIRSSDQRVGCLRLGDSGILMLGQCGGSFFVRDRHAIALDWDLFKFLDEVGQLGTRYPEWQVDRIEPQLAKSLVMNEWTETVGHGIANDAVDLSVGIDLIVEVNS